MSVSNDLDESDRQLIVQCRNSLKSQPGLATLWTGFFWLVLAMAGLTTFVVGYFLITDGTIPGRGGQALVNNWLACGAVVWLRSAQRRREALLRLVVKLTGTVVPVAESTGAVR